MEHKERLTELLQEYFDKNTLMQLATVSNGNPWLCNVYFVTDEDNNIYWSSLKSRRHSKEILNNPLSACTIVHNGEKKQALQITGKSYMISLEDSERVDNLYSKKFGEKPTRLEEVRENLPEGRAYWVLKPETISFWDEVSFPDQPKQEYK